MKLHYSQTTNQISGTIFLVSVPYEITLLSNTIAKGAIADFVSVPYEITLLSNHVSDFKSKFDVSVPYEITLLSNLK